MLESERRNVNWLFRFCNFQPLRIDRAGIGFPEEAKHAHFHTPKTFWLGVVSFGTPEGSLM
jgi:hypothetical protein